MVELRTFGRIEVRDAVTGAEIVSVASQPKRLALLVYLALATPRGPHRRDTLLLQFWAELSDRRARRALNQALHVLRKEIGPEVFESRGNEAVGLLPAAYDCDVLAFERAIEERRLEAALELYAGPFLDGFHVPDTHDFEDWMDRERRRLQREARNAARSLAETTATSGNPHAAVKWARRARDIDPWDEEMLRHEMRLLAGLGQRGQAIRAFEAYAERMGRELELEPSTPTRELAAKLRADDGGFGAVQVAARPQAATQSSIDAADPPTTGRSARSIAYATGISVLALTLLATYALSADDRPPAADTALRPVPTLHQNRVLVVPFANRTGDPSLDPLGRMAADWLTQGLARTGIVEVIPTHETVHDLRFLAEAEADSAGIDDPALARRLAGRAAAGLVVLGSYYAHGDSALLQAQVLSTRTGEALRGIEGVAGPLSHPLAAVEELRGRLIGAMATVLDRRLASWSDAASQPPSYEAYLAYARGLDLFTPQTLLEAGEALSGAGDVDAGFTSPLLWAVFAYANGGDRTRADSLLELLGQHRETLAPLDRAILDYLAARRADDLRETYLAARRVVDLSPGSEWQYKLAEAALDLRRPTEAVAILEGLDPDHGWMVDWSPYWMTLLDAYHQLGDYEAEYETATEGLRRFTNQRNVRQRLRFHLASALIGMGRGDSALTVYEPIFVEPRPPGRMALWLVPLLGELTVHDQTESLRKLATRALAWHASLPDSTRRTLCSTEAEILLIAGRLTESRALFQSCREWTSGFAREWSGVAFAAVSARLGDTASALDGLAWIDTMTTPSEPRRLTLKAMVLANFDREQEAVDLLRQALDSGRWYASGFLHVDPFLQPLQSRPDYQALVSGGK